MGAALHEFLHFATESFRCGRVSLECDRVGRFDMLRMGHAKELQQAAGHMV